MGKGERFKNGLRNIGWLVAFPVPVTKALAKGKGGKTKRKVATIAAAWAMYLGLATAGVTTIVNPSHGTNTGTDFVQESDEYLPEDTDNPFEETDRDRVSVGEGQAEMECHLFYLDRMNMERLPKEVYCVTKINGEDFRNDLVVAAGDTLTIETTVLDSRSSARRGSTKYTYTVEEENLINGFELSFNTTLEDWDDPEYWYDIMLVYEFVPKAQEEPVNENELSLAVADRGVLVGGYSEVSVVGKTDREVIFSSSNTDVATVSRGGGIEGIRPGRAVITATEIETGRKGEVTVWVGEPHWGSIDSYVTMEDGCLDESEWEVMTLIDSEIGYTANDILPGDTYSYTLRVQRKSNPDEVFEKQISHVISEGDYESGFVVRIYLPVTVKDADGKEHTEYFCATFDCTVLTE